MFIDKINLKCYRNIKNLHFEPNKNFNIIYGNNAQGKTNIIEAIYFMANLKSYKNSKNEEIIKHDEIISTIESSFFSKQIFKNIKIIIERKNKSVKIDNKKPDSLIDFFKYIRPILFSPEETFLLKGSPSSKRTMLDRAVFQANPIYLTHVMEYNRYLKQRNILLKEVKSKFELEPWTYGLVSAGTRVRLSRLNYINKIVPIFKSIFTDITKGNEIADIFYPHSDKSEEHLKEYFYLELKKTEDKERILGQTISGPHRDDPIFLINGHSLRQFGSQGQQRSFMLAFKISQVVYLESILGETPILLLDDMMGELDSTRQKYFYEFLSKCSGQVFLTTTDIKTIKDINIKNRQFFQVNNGTIQETTANKELI